MPAPVIDWVLSGWIADRVAGRGDSPAAATSGIDLRPLAADAERRVIAYTGLHPSGPIPLPEGVSRREWVASNIASTRMMIDPLLDTAAEKLGPAKDAGRLWLGAITSAELGLLIGYMSQRVLGQYELALLAPAAGTEPDPPRLLFVLPNLDQAVTRFEADDLEFVTWVTLHEVTHAVQFGGVPWLRGYLGSLIQELMDNAEKRMTIGRSLRLPSGKTLKRIGRAVLHGDVLGIVASEDERSVLDRAQAVMAVIEGHAEHVMDAVAPELLPSLPDLRAALDKRRKSQTGVSKAVGRLLGMEMKLRQYSQGKVFCDAIVKARRPEALHYVFSSPEALPTLAEIEDPDAWIERNRAHL